MNTKTVEEIHSEFTKETGLNPYYAPQLYRMEYIRFLEQKLLTPSPERGKEGKTVEEINNSIETILFSAYLVGKESISTGTSFKSWFERNSVLESVKKLFDSQSTSKPVTDGRLFWEYLEKINNIMWESFMIKGKGISDKDCEKIMVILEEWAEKKIPNKASKPVEPKTSVGEELIHIVSEKINTYIDTKPIPDFGLNSIELAEYIISGLSMQQGRGDAIEFANWVGSQWFDWDRLSQRWYREEIFYTTDELYLTFTQSRGTEGG